MKITESQLRSLVNEELKKMSEEGELDEVLGGLGALAKGVGRGLGAAGSAVTSAAKGAIKTIGKTYSIGEAERAYKKAFDKVESLKKQLQQEEANLHAATEAILRLSSSNPPSAQQKKQEPAPAPASKPQASGAKPEARKELGV